MEAGGRVKIHYNGKNWTGTIAAKKKRKNIWRMVSCGFQFGYLDALKNSLKFIKEVAKSVTNRLRLRSPAGDSRFWQ